VLLVACAGFAAVVFFPSTPFGFLRGARLQDIEVENGDYAAAMVIYGATGPPPEHVTYRRYAVEGDGKELVRKAKAELTSTKGWTIFQELGDDAVAFARGYEFVWVAGANVRPDNLGVNTVVTVTPTSSMDRILDKVHKDERPPVQQWP
jgi:hypothetical protein